MKRFVLLLLGLLLIQPGVYAFSFNIDKPGIHIISRPGKVIDGTIEVTNTGTDTLSLRTYVSDWKTAPDGSKEFYPAGTIANSCAGWLNVQPREFDLAPGGKQKLTYIMTVPKIITGGHYSAIFVETVLNDLSKKSNVLVAGRIGSIVYHTVEGTEAVSGDLSDLAVEGSKHNDITVRYAFRNNGNTYQLVKPTLALLDDKGKIVLRKKLDKFGVMPGQKLERTAQLAEKLDQKKYTALVTVEYGNEDFKVLEKDFAPGKLPQVEAKAEPSSGTVATVSAIADSQGSDAGSTNVIESSPAQQISILKFSPVVNNKNMKLFLVQQNISKAPVIVSVKVAVYDLFKNKKKEFVLAKKMLIKPGARNNLSKSVPHGLKKGRYIATVEIAAGDSLARDEREIVIR